MFGERYPRKPLTHEQVRENRRHAVRYGRAEAEYERGKEELREALAKKYGVEWESELEGDWETVGRFHRPHVAEPDFEKFTEAQRKSWDLDEQMAKMISYSYDSIFKNRLFSGDSIIYAGSDKTIKWVRAGDKV